MVQSNYSCPACSTILTPHRFDPGTSFVCSRCGGTAIALAVVRQHASAALAKSIWSAARSSPVTSSDRKCPSCQRLLRTFDIVESIEKTQLDACVSCQFLWFDANELAALGISFKELHPDA